MSKKPEDYYPSKVKQDLEKEEYEAEVRSDKRIIKLVFIVASALAGLMFLVKHLFF